MAGATPAPARCSAPLRARCLAAHRGAPAAANPWWSALADVAAAAETAIKAPLALDETLVERRGKQQARNANAAAVAPVRP
jgi:hypothetical protein